MANQVKWSQQQTTASLLTTELNSLANNTLSALGPDYDNSTNRWMYAEVEVVLASLTPSAGGSVMVYLAAAPDGTNYGDAKREATEQLLCSFTFDAAASAKRGVARNVLLPACHFKAYLDNQTGVALAASGNTVKIMPYVPEVQ